MNVYVETNFVFELVFQQEQSESCENVLSVCESQNIPLLLPAYCLAEPHEKLRRQYSNRQDLQRVLNAELTQLARTSSYAQRIQSIKDVTNLLVQSSKEEGQRFTQTRDYIVQVGTVIPLTSDILLAAAISEQEYNLSPQDAIVFASVVGHLRQNSSAESCFLNRNSKDFNNPDIVDALEQYNCKMIPEFDDGYRYIQSRVGAGQP